MLIIKYRKIFLLLFFSLFPFNFSCCFLCLLREVEVFCVLELVWKVVTLAKTVIVITVVRTEIEVWGQADVNIHCELLCSFRFQVTASKYFLHTAKIKLLKTQRKVWSYCLSYCLDCLWLYMSYVRHHLGLVF